MTIQGRNKIPITPGDLRRESIKFADPDSEELHSGRRAAPTLADGRERIKQWNLAMANSWFICTNDVVSGPFSTEQVRNQIASGALHTNSFIWWKGQPEWIPLSTWESQLAEILKAKKEKAENKIWYIDLGMNTLGPLTQSELIENLRGQESFGRINLWSVGMEKWTSIFDMREVMEEVGISRRLNERAPLMGSVAVSRSNIDPRSYVMKAASISMAGMRVTGEHDLRRGDHVTIVIKSASLPASLHLSGEVAYVTSQGYVGVRFVKAQPEAQTIIVDYVKRFIQDEVTSRNAA
jgi:hypothetical protein